MARQILVNSPDLEAFTVAVVAVTTISAPTIAVATIPAPITPPIPRASCRSRYSCSGGFSPRAATADTASKPFQPETVDAFEIGTKLSLLDRKLQLNFAAFVSDYKDMQQNLTVPGGPTGNQTITGNVAGGALIKGLEFDGTLRIADGFKITATAAIMDSHFRDFIANGVQTGGAIGPYDYSGNRLIYAPDFSGSIEAEYKVPISIGSIATTIGLRHIAPYDEQLSVQSLTNATINGAPGVVVNGNDTRVRTTTQDLLDASATLNFSLGGSEAYARIYGRNLLDERTTTHAFTVAGLWSFGMGLEPATYGATVGVKF